MKRFRLNGILAVALVSAIVGFSFVACGDNGGGGGGGDRRVTFWGGTMRMISWKLSKFPEAAG